MATIRRLRAVSLRTATKQNLILYMSMLSGFMAPGWALANQGGQSAESDYSYFYFKEQRRLELDATRIAIHSTHAAATLGSAFESELDISAAEPMAIRQWSFVPTTGALRTEQAIRRTVGRMAGDERIDFVSPVFVDDGGGPLVVSRQILVRFDRDLEPAAAEAILAQSGAGTILDRDWANMQRTYRLQSFSRDGFEVLEAANRLAQLPEVVFAEPDMFASGRLLDFPNDTYFPRLWGLHNDGSFPIYCTALPDFDMDAPEAWDLTIGDPSVLVAILDTGVQLDHPDLNLFPFAFDATGEGGGGGPFNACDDHGTYVAGCVSAAMDNGIGVVGVAPGALSASVRVLSADLACDGSVTIVASAVVAGLAWAEAVGARISNSSWYRSSPSSAIDQKYADTRANGMIHFAAAGNFAMETILYPASLPSINAVAALDPCGDRAVFSNYGVGLAFSAPGHYGISTDRTGSDGGNDGVDDGGCLPSGTLGCNVDGDCAAGETCLLVSTDYALVAGTSFAAPAVAGVAALILSARPDLTADQVEYTLQNTAVDLGPPGYDTDFGWGFVNAFDAVQWAIATSAEPAPGSDPDHFALRANRPNPFDGGTHIGYDLTRAATVELRVLDVRGRVVRTLAAHFETAGPHDFLWDGTDTAGSRLAAGVYLFELRVDGESRIQKGLLLH